RVEPRTDSNYDQVRDNISEDLASLINADKKTLTAISKAAMQTAKDAAWSNFISFYINAFDIALCNAQKRNKQ
ncbi:MAG: glycosyl transferase, partial [Muribaculaceae bacterium]|nr:glycosyl transferase [Muribaculaceae bacterium]